MFFTPALADGFSEDAEWKQVSLSYFDSFKNYVQSQQYWSLLPSPPVSVPIPGDCIERILTIGIIFTFNFDNFFERSRDLSHFSLSFSFTLWFARTAKSSIRQVLFFFVDYLYV